MTISMPARKRVRCILGTIFLPAVAALGVSLISAGASWSQTYPSKLIKLVVPLTPGSPIDVLARLTEPLLASRLGQKIIVENRAGAAGRIGTGVVAKSDPDGHTLLVSTESSLVIAPHIVAAREHHVSFDGLAFERLAFGLPVRERTLFEIEVERLAILADGPDAGRNGAENRSDPENQHYEPEQSNLAKRRGHLQAY